MTRIGFRLLGVVLAAELNRIRIADSLGFEDVDGEVPASFNCLVTRSASLWRGVAEAAVGHEISIAGAKVTPPLQPCIAANSVGCRTGI